MDNFCQNETLQLSKRIHALVVEDNPADADLLKESLETQLHPEVELHWALRLSDALEMIKIEHFDVLLLELALPDSCGLDTLKKVRDCDPDLPILILTSLADRQLGLQAVQQGAQDYLVKGQPNGESIHRAIRYAIERKRSERLARETATQALESEARLRLALKSSQTGVWTWHIDDDRYEWDGELRRIFGGIANPSHQQFLNLVHRDDRSRVNEAIQAAIQRRDEYECEYRIVRLDGSIRWVTSLGKAFFDITGNALKMTGACHEITKQKEQEETKQRIKLLEQRQEFVAMLAHDLRTPVIGSQRVLSHIISGILGEIPPDVKELLSKICNSNESMLHMITNVMDCYRLESDCEHLDLCEVDLKALVMSCASELKPLAATSDIQLSFFINTQSNVYGDKVAMQRVLGNLIGNAIKFTPPGGKIEVTAQTLDGRILLQVSDTGIGIAPEDYNNIFDRFFQTDRKYRAKGLGLGLYLCRKLLDAQCGTITCKSVLGSGTTFEITLPSTAPPLVRILVADNTAITRVVLQNALQSLSVQVDLVTTGTDALAAVKDHDYTAIFVDLMIKDGHSTPEALRVAGINVPIVAYSGSSISGESQLLFSGLTDFVPKPRSEKEITDLICKWTAVANQESELGEAMVQSA